jgi:hypothetical protein
VLQNHNNHLVVHAEYSQIRILWTYSTYSELAEVVPPLNAGAEERVVLRYHPVMTGSGNHSRGKQVSLGDTGSCPKHS